MTEKWREDLAREPETVPCRFCGAETLSTGTKLCDRCWELSSRIRREPELARKILDEVAK